MALKIRRALFNAKEEALRDLKSLEFPGGSLTEVCFLHQSTHWFWKQIRFGAQVAGNAENPNVTTAIWSIDYWDGHA